MELKLNKEEIVKILLTWAEQNYPGKFNELTWDMHNRPQHVTFEWSKATEMESKEPQHGD